jgi:tRNA (guanine10-N2)-dimethyltransferase
MIFAVWLSKENLPLAHAELRAVVERLGGNVSKPAASETPTDRDVVELPDASLALALSDRLALAHRVATVWPETDLVSIEARLRRAGISGASASIRAAASGIDHSATDFIRRLGAAYRLGGGRIDLENPSRQFFVEPSAMGQLHFYERVAGIERPAFVSRNNLRLPFRRPVTMEPRLARALVNLGHVGPGDRVADPFVGTGALLLEATLLGADTVGVDASAAMVRGTIQNFAHLGLTPGKLRQADSAEAAQEFGDSTFDAVVTDPPYGRASGTRGEKPETLLGRTLRAWIDRVRRGGRLAFVTPSGLRLPAIDARLELVIPQRVHRSLTREFRVYLRE